MILSKVIWVNHPAPDLRRDSCQAVGWCRSDSLDRRRLAQPSTVGCFYVLVIITNHELDTKQQSEVLSAL